MKQITLGVIGLALVMLLTACGVGIIYTHTWRPLTVDLHHAKAVPTSAEGDIKYVHISYAGVAWDSAAIGDVAKRHGLTELYSADLETFSVLTVWNQYTLHLYGK